MPHPQLAVNEAQVVHETIDGETIVIHLGSGAYYSLDGCGAAVWEQLVAGACAEEVIASTQTRYEADPQEVAQPVKALIEGLLAEGLIVESEAPGGAAVQPEGEAAVSPASAVDMAETRPTGRAPFVAPVLNKYTDMQEFMLADPLHDVEQEAGWPRLKDG